jgi:hypothetical protein
MSTKWWRGMATSWVWFLLAAGRENAAGDGAGFFPHLRWVFFGGYVPQIHGCVVESACDPGGCGCLARGESEAAVCFGDGFGGTGARGFLVIGRLRRGVGGRGGGGWGHFFFPFDLRVDIATCAA